MLLNATALAGLTTGFKTSFQQGFNSVESYYQQVATVVPSTTAANAYPWLSDLPTIREWIGDRQALKLSQFAYTLTNKPWELTIEVDRDAVADDQYGVYAPLMENLGFEAARFPDQLVFPLLANAFTSLCYDGQYFCDTDHPGFDASGTAASVSNSGGGSSNPWFLLDTRRPLKPLIYQERQKFAFGLLENENPGAAVPVRKALRYGTNGRANAGYGLWQQCYGSKDTLNATNLNAGIAAMMSLRKSTGQPMGVKPNLLVCGPSNRAAALTEVKASQAANGATNINQGVVDVLVVEWLT